MTRRRLTIWLLLFFLALVLPTSILVYQAYGQLKWEAFHQHQQLARELSLRIDAGFRDLVEREENRPISDYEFLNVAGSDGSAFLQRSPLSQFPLESELPGLMGYFQVDASGQLHTPIVPQANAANYGISPSELRQREQQVGRIRRILEQNRLTGKSDLAAAPATEIVEQELQIENLNRVSELDSLSSATAGDYRKDNNIADSKGGPSLFDKLTSRNLSAPDETKAPSSQVKDLKLEYSYEITTSAVSKSQQPTSKKNAEKRLRKEQVNLPQALPRLDNNLGASVAESVVNEATDEPLVSQQAIRIETFEGEVEAMEFAQLDSGHSVLFRRVWHKNERYVQGILIDQGSFIEELIAPAFRQSSLSSMSELIVAYRGGILQSFTPQYSRLYQPGAKQTNNELLFQSRLIAPFDSIELIYTLARLPIGAGGKIIIWSTLVLAIVLIGGCFILYRLGLRQLALVQQQQDFVSAVSHELKTPLTSIRMYGEMLREGWADEEKRKTYYDFIFHESERLTRLINNVLQLARMSRNEQTASLAAVSLEQVIADLKPRLESQLEPSGFSLSLQGDDTRTDSLIKIDNDGFLQIFINLVDNALKFSSNAEIKRIDFGHRQVRDGVIQFSVRDYGPGIAPDQMKKIFQLFYRSENELTRETVGTGIGLALVQQLASAMQAEVDLVNCEPGVEFRISFPIYK